MCDRQHFDFNVREVEDPSELSHSELIEKQLSEIFGEDNKRYAQDALGREPSPGELILHYAKNGGPDDFTRRHGRPTCIVKFEFYD